MGPDKVYHVRINDKKQSKLGSGGYMTYEEFCFHLPRITRKLGPGDSLAVYCEAREPNSGERVRPRSRTGPCPTADYYPDGKATHGIVGM